MTTLAGIINAPSTAGSVKLGGDPVLAPPIYGRWHAAKPTVDPAGATWLDQINLDPRWRVDRRLRHAGGADSTRKP